MDVELPSELQWLAPLVSGGSWPGLSETELRELAAEWGSVAAEFAPLHNEVVYAVSGAANAVGGHGGESFDEYIRDLVAHGPEMIAGIVRTAGQVEEGLNQTALAVETAKLNIVIALAVLAAQLLYYAAMAVFTFGASEAAAPVAIEATQSVVWSIARTLISGILEGAAMMAGIDALVQAIEIFKGDRRSFDVGETLGSAGMGALAGGLGAGVGMGLGKLAPNLAGSVGGRIASGVVVGGVSNYGAQLIFSAAEGQFDPNPMGLVAGAVGGAVGGLHPAGGPHPAGEPHVPGQSFDRPFVLDHVLPDGAVLPLWVEPTRNGSLFVHAPVDAPAVTAPPPLHDVVRDLPGTLVLDTAGPTTPGELGGHLTQVWNGIRGGRPEGAPMPETVVLTAPAGAGELPGLQRFADAHGVRVLAPDGPVRVAGDGASLLVDRPAGDRAGTGAGQWAVLSPRSETSRPVEPVVAQVTERSSGGPDAVRTVVEPPQPGRAAEPVRGGGPEPVRGAGTEPAGGVVQAERDPAVRPRTVVDRVETAGGQVVGAAGPRPARSQPAAQAVVHSTPARGSAPHVTEIPAVSARAIRELSSDPGERHATVTVSAPGGATHAPGPVPPRSSIDSEPRSASVGQSTTDSDATGARRQRTGDAGPTLAPVVVVDPGAVAHSVVGDPQPVPAGAHPTPAVVPADPLNRWYGPRGEAWRQYRDEIRQRFADRLSLEESLGWRARDASRIDEELARLRREDLFGGRYLTPEAATRLSEHGERRLRELWWHAWDEAGPARPDATAWDATVDAVRDELAGQYAYESGKGRALAQADAALDAALGDGGALLQREPVSPEGEQRVRERLHSDVREAFDAEWRPDAPGSATRFDTRLQRLIDSLPERLDFESRFETARDGFRGEFDGALAEFRRADLFGGRYLDEGTVARIRGEAEEQLRTDLRDTWSRDGVDGIDQAGFGRLRERLAAGLAERFTAATERIRLDGMVREAYDQVLADVRGQDLFGGAYLDEAPLADVATTFRAEVDRVLADAPGGSAAARWERHRDMLTERLRQRLTLAGETARVFDHGRRSWSEDITGRRSDPTAEARLTDGARERAYADFAGQVRRAYERIWGDEPAGYGTGRLDDGRRTAWEHELDRLADGLFDRLEYERGLTESLSTAARDFDELAGDGLTGYDVPDEALRRVGDEFRTQWVEAYDRAFGAGDRDVAGWLAHERANGDAFGTALDRLREGRAAGADRAGWRSPISPELARWWADQPPRPARAGGAGPATTPVDADTVARLSPDRAVIDPPEWTVDAPGLRDWVTARLSGADRYNVPTLARYEYRGAYQRITGRSAPHLPDEALTRVAQEYHGKGAVAARQLAENLVFVELTGAPPRLLGGMDAGITEVSDAAHPLGASGMDGGPESGTRRTVPQTETPEHRRWTEAAEHATRGDTDAVDRVVAQIAADRGREVTVVEIRQRFAVHRLLTDPQRLPRLTVMIDEALNFGHQAAGLTLIDSLRELGFDRQLTVVSSSAVREKLADLAGDRLDALDWVDRDKYDAEQSYTDARVGVDDGPPLVLIGASDSVGPTEEEATNLLNYLGADTAMVFQPYAWRAGPRLAYHRAGPGQPAHVIDVGAGIDEYALFHTYVPPIGGVADARALLDAALSRPVAGGLHAVVEAALGGSVDVMPVYGLHRLEEDIRSGAGATLAAALHEAGLDRPALLLEISDSTVDFAPAYAPAWLHRADASDPGLAERIAALAPGDVLVVRTGGVPQDVFRLLYQLGTVPAVLEGANTANTAQLLGRPYLSPRPETTYDATRFPRTDEATVDEAAIARLGEVTEALTVGTKWTAAIRESDTYAELGHVRTAVEVIEARQRYMDRAKPAGEPADGQYLTQDEFDRLRAAVPSDQLTGIALEFLGDHPEVHAAIAHDPDNYRLLEAAEKRRIPASPDKLTLLLKRLRERRGDLVRQALGEHGNVSNDPDPEMVARVAAAIRDLMPGATGPLRDYADRVARAAHDPGRDQVLQGLYQLVETVDRFRPERPPEDPGSDSIPDVLAGAVRHRQPTDSAPGGDPPEA
ncbi:hypothetical protein HC031_20195 [Planosporangium thailandense]|uniref:Outer membrane channel protein CpnT-like N-terminal domain-containing protein n=1 Tax=Planosporangium thailandense TaxID=765197 RepID=A0ABX0Y3W3_9ACTN|nr:hypothetical protein [Planosporangium thailandense]NJC72019.1 hypothetical protein [Planosporangium thailandense]